MGRDSTRAKYLEQREGRQVSCELRHTHFITVTLRLLLRGIKATAVDKPQSFTAGSLSICAEAVAEPIDRFKGIVDPSVMDPRGF